MTRHVQMVINGTSTRIAKSWLVQALMVQVQKPNQNHSFMILIFFIFHINLFFLSFFCVAILASDKSTIFWELGIFHETPFAKVEASTNPTIFCMIQTNVGFTNHTLSKCIRRTMITTISKTHFFLKE